MAWRRAGRRQTITLNHGDHARWCTGTRVKILQAEIKCQIRRAVAPFTNMY